MRLKNAAFLENQQKCWHEISTSVKLFESHDVDEQ